MPITAYSDPVYDAIRAHLLTQWIDTPIQWPNEEFSASGIDAWVKFEIHGSNYGQVEVGMNTQAQNRWDSEGVIWMFVIVPRGTGFTNAGGAAKALANVFRGLTLISGRLEFLDATIGVGARRDEDGEWYVVPVSVEWQHTNS